MILLPAFSFLANLALSTSALATASQQPLGVSTAALSQKNVPGFHLDLDQRRLVQFSADQAPVWITERDKLGLKRNGTGFMDITDVRIAGPKFSPKQHYTYPDLTNSPATSIVKDIIPTLSTAEPRSNLHRFSAFKTRFYNSTYGLASSKWLKSKIEQYIWENHQPEEKRNITVSLVDHNFLQNSVGPLEAKDTDPIVIVGAHCDSRNRVDPWDFAPGADDDGSGTVAILEAFRGILVSGYVPKSPIEFHFYAGEEGGLLGSQDIVAQYEAAGRNVREMQQFDTIAWVKEGTKEVIAVFTDHVDRELTGFQKRLVDKYLSIPWAETNYAGMAGSDHFSWTAAGYQTCHVSEAKFENMNHHLHTVNDSIHISKEFSFDHLLEYSKLAVAFAVELSNY